jgi:hypothetical protein
MTKNTYTKKRIQKRNPQNKNKKITYTKKRPTRIFWSYYYFVEC